MFSGKAPGFVLMAALFISLLSGCGGSGSGGSTVSVLTVLPAATNVLPGTQRGFQFFEQGSGNAQTGVVWSVKEANGGSIDTNGLYTAPSTPGTYHVVLTNAANSAQTAVATVNVQSSGTILSVSKHQVIVNPGSVTPLQSLVTVTGNANTGLLWKIFSPNLGTVDSAGSYTAPSTPGDYYVSVASLADPTQSDAILMQVTGVTITITPTSVPLFTAAPYRFGYNIQVIGSTNNSVVWATTDSAGNVVTGQGSIDQNGNYTSPTVPGTYYVTVSSAVRPDVKATATVTVLAKI